MNFTDNTVLRQLCGDHGKLLDAINDARSLLGVAEPSDPPMLIVCGTSSSGKSSVLQAISRLKFPSTNGINRCTQFVTEVRLRRCSSASTKVSIVPGPSCTDETEKARLQCYLHDALPSGYTFPDMDAVARQQMGLMGPDRFDDVSDHVLKFDVSGPDQPQLTLVDLPGLDLGTTEKDDEKSAGEAKELVERYMASPRSIILLVVSAEHENDIKELLDMARQFDSNGERTLGIITHPDSLDRGSQREASFLQILRNERMYLSLGWHALRNHFPEESSMTDDTRDEQERDFFDQGGWANLLPDCVGAESLRRRLSGILFEHHQRCLPALVRGLQKRISTRQATLSKLGNPRSTIQSQRAYLLDIANGFERITNQAVDEMYMDIFFNSVGKAFIRRTIRQLNDFFAEAMATRGAKRWISDGTAPTPVPSAVNPYLQGWSPQCIPRAAVEAEACEIVRNYGAEAAGNVNRTVAGILFRVQAQPWERLARAHLLKAWESVRHFAFVALRHLADGRTSVALARSVLEPALEKVKQDVLKKLTELSLQTKRYVPLPMSKAEKAQVEKARKTRLLQSLESKLISENGNNLLYYIAAVKETFIQMDAARDEFAAAEIVDHMQLHYDTAVTTFVNNVNTLAVENSLLSPLRGIFTSQVVNSMDDSQIHELAAEPPKVTEERTRLCKEVDEFRAAIRALDVFRPLELSFETLSMHTESDAPSRKESPVSQKTPTSSQASASPPAASQTESPAYSHTTSYSIYRDPVTDLTDSETVVSDSPSGSLTPKPERPRKRVRPVEAISETNELQFSGIKSTSTRASENYATTQNGLASDTSDSRRHSTHSQASSVVRTRAAEPAWAAETMKNNAKPATRTTGSVSVSKQARLAFPSRVGQPGTKRAEKRTLANAARGDSSGSGIPVPTSFSVKPRGSLSDSRWSK